MGKTVLAGRVTEKGKPVIGAEVEVAPYVPLPPDPYAEDVHEPEPIARAQTDQDGNYSITELPQGEYTIQVNKLHLIKPRLSRRVSLKDPERRLEDFDFESNYHRQRRWLVLFVLKGTLG